MLNFLFLSYWFVSPPSCSRRMPYVLTLSFSFVGEHAPRQQRSIEGLLTLPCIGCFETKKSVGDVI